MDKSIIKFLIAAIFISVFFAPNVLSMGLISDPILIPDAIRGQEIIEELSLLNSSDNEETYQLKTEGEIASWTAFYMPEDKDFKNPVSELAVAARQYGKVAVKFTIPKEAANKEYQGEILMMYMPPAQDGNRMDVRVGQQIGRTVTIIVSDKEAINFETWATSKNYDVAKNETFTIQLGYQNNGNVNLKPDVQVLLSGNGSEISNLIYPFPSGISPIMPNEYRVIPDAVKLATAGMETGDYSAKLKFLVNGKDYGEKNISFSVGKSGSGLLASLAGTAGKNPFVYWTLIAAGLVFAGMAGKLFLNKFKRQQA